MADLKITPIYDEVDGNKVISLFPSAFRDKFIISEEEIEINGIKYGITQLLKSLILSIKELKVNYDVIIKSSFGEIIDIISDKIKSLISYKSWYNDIFLQYTANEVYDSFIECGPFEQNTKEYMQNVHRLLLQGIIQMNKNKVNGGNDGIFSYKFAKDETVKDVIKQSLSANDEFSFYSDIINGGRVMVIDDSNTDNDLLSDSAKTIMEMYDPKSITFLTLFSPLKK